MIHSTSVQTTSEREFTICDPPFIWKFWVFWPGQLKWPDHLLKWLLVSRGVARSDSPESWSFRGRDHLLHLEWQLELLDLDNLKVVSQRKFHLDITLIHDRAVNFSWPLPPWPLVDETIVLSSASHKYYHPHTNWGSATLAIDRW